MEMNKFLQLAYNYIENKTRASIPIFKFILAMKMNIFLQLENKLIENKRSVCVCICVSIKTENKNDLQLNSSINLQKRKECTTFLKNNCKGATFK